MIWNIYACVENSCFGLNNNEFLRKSKIIENCCHYLM